MECAWRVEEHITIPARRRRQPCSWSDAYPLKRVGEQGKEKNSIGNGKGNFMHGRDGLAVTETGCVIVKENAKTSADQAGRRKYTSQNMRIASPVARSTKRYVVRTIHEQEPANIYYKLLEYACASQCNPIGASWYPVREISMSFGRGTEGCHENGPVATYLLSLRRLLWFS
jgi:hypothetical protein